jgi:hypothetical protein
MTKARFSAFSKWALLVFLTALTAVRAQVEGPNGHYYEVVLQPSVSWEQAKAAAEQSTFNGVHGHLATVTSVEEDQFIENLRIEAAPGGYNALWVGGYQEGDANTPTDGWYWVNGEGAIATSTVGQGYSNWQPTEPNDYWGPRSENYLAVGHFNNFGWNDYGNDGSVHGYVIEYPSTGRASMVKVSSPDPIAIEHSGQNAPTPSPLDTAQFVFTRTGSLTLDLPVYYTVHGTAVNGVDYNEITRSVIIPAGQSEVTLTIVPRVDALTVVEPMETVGIRLEPSLILTPGAAYDIDPNGREAGAVIYEHAVDQPDSAELAIPRNGFTYKPDETVTILVAVDHSAQPVTKVEFFAGAAFLGVVTPTDPMVGLEFFKLNWTGAPAGKHELRARVTLSSGVQLMTHAFTITVEGTPPPPLVGMRFIEPTSTEPVPDADYAPGYIAVVRDIANTAGDLQVFYSVGGTATAGVDYESLQGYIVIPDGKTGAKIVVTAIDDTIDEPNETVFVSLIPPPAPANPVDAGGGYTIDPTFKTAEVVILDNDKPANAPPVATLAKPADGSVYIDGAYETIVGNAVDSDGSVVRIEVLLDNVPIASKDGSLIEHRFSPDVGPHSIAIRATDDKGATDLSEVANILVRDRHEVAFVHRELPAAYSPNVPFIVELRADPPEGTFAYAVEDRPPAGWRVTEVSEDGAFDTVNGKVKFGPFFDTLPRTLTYRVTPPASAVGAFEFDGNGSVNGAIYPIMGDSGVELARQYHPADSNQDFRIVLSEVTAYAAAWKAGNTWTTGPVPIPLNYVTRAHHIWQRGETYAFNPSAGAAPACWVTTSGGTAGFKAAAVGSAQRSLFGDMRADAATQVRISATPATGSSGYAVEERPPHGWTISNISHEGVVDPSTGVIRWGVFADGLARTLSYTVTPPPTVSSVGIFAGQLSYDGKLMLVGSGGSFDASVTINGAAPITMTAALAPNGLKLNITGPTGQTGVIEASSDFYDWTEVKSIFIPDGAVEFTDEPPAAGRRFYRLRVQ